MKEEILSIKTAEKLATLKQLEKIILEYDKEANILTQKVNNLQKTIEVIKNTNKLLIKQKSQLQEDLDMLGERIDKAVEYIKNNWYSKNTRNIDELHSLGDWRLDLLEILNGGDK